MLKNYNKKITFANHNYCRGDFVASDPQGMYTGVPADMYYNGELEKPIQDADDL